MRRTLLALATASFVGYFLFLHFTVYYGREPLGFVPDFRADGVHVPHVTPGSPADRAGFKAGDRLVSLNGKPMRNANDVALLFAILPLHVESAWHVERAETMIPLTVRPLGRQWGIPDASHPVGSAALGLSLGLGILLLWRGPPVLTTLIGGWLLMSLGCVYLPRLPNSFSPLWRDLAAPVQALLWPAAISSLSAHLLLFVFSALVPRPLLSRVQLTSALIPGVAITAYLTLIVTMLVYSPEAAMTLPLPAWFMVVGPMSYPVYFVGAALLLMRSARSAADTTERRKAQTLLTGAIFGGAGLLVVAWGLLSEEILWTQTGATVVLAGMSLFSVLPISFAYAMLRHELFDLRIIIRIGLQYALARGAILGVIPLLVVVLLADAALHSDQTLRSILGSRGWTYMILASIVGVIYVKRHEWMTAIDRRFFRERYAAQQILKHVVEDVGASPSFDAAAQKVIGRIDSALHPVMAAVMTKPRTSTAFVTIASSGAKTPPIPVDSPIAQVARALGKPVATGALGIGGDIDLIVPIALGPNDDDALLVLGPRRSEEPYSNEDKELLATIAASLRLLMGRRAAAADMITSAVAGSPRLFGNRYRIDHPIGEGGMGMVYAATDETLQRTVAIKVIRDQHLTGDALARFQREARTAASLSHPHIVTVHDFGTDESGSPYLVMELLEGESLRATITRGRVPVERAIAILTGLASAIDTAHAKGVVHRDLKPENVFLTGHTHAKILDYGIAKIASATGATGATGANTTGGILGTIAYMSPEQAGGASAAPAWDVWALSVIAFEMLTGQHPFNGGLPIARAIQVRTLVPEMNASIADAIDRGLSLDPRHRPATASQLIHSAQT